MKKKILILLMAVIGLCGYAQDNRQAVGLNLGIAPYVGSHGSFTNFQLGLLYQYNLTDNIRLEGDLDYGFKDNGIGIFDISANVHYLFHMSDKFMLYPLVGIGYANASGFDQSWSRFLFNLGLGAEYSIADNIGVGLKANYQYIKDFARLPISIYATYKF